MSRRRKRGFRVRQCPSKAIDYDRDLPRLTAWLEQRRINDMLNQERQHSFSVSDVNRYLYPWYDKGRTYRCEASPGLLLLRAAEAQGLVEQTGYGYWRDARRKTTIGELVKGAR